MEHETNYRYLLITFLVSCGMKLDLYENKARRSFHLLLKLLSLQTHESQNILINLMGGNVIDENNLGFISKYNEHLFKKIILLFIEFFNPPDKLLDNNYVCSFLLINIFKYLCKEHNNFFQSRFMKSLNYKYIEEIPVFYKESTKEGEKSKIGYEFESLYSPGGKFKNIKLVDFFLHVILKIILISEWDKLDYIDEYNKKQNEYLYDIFESILEMLIEIIQGNRPENLNNLGKTAIQTFEKQINNDEKLIDAINSRQFFLSKSVCTIKMLQESKKEIIKVDTFEYFVKNMTNFILNDKISNKFLYKIKNHLMNFFITILEEKNCKEEIQKFIIKYININRVFNIISSILKLYYLRESTENEIEKVIKNIKGDFQKFQKSIIISQRQSNPQILKEVNYDDLFKKATTYLDNNRKRISYDFSMKRDHIKIKKEKDRKILFNEKLFEFYRNLYFSFKDFNQTDEFKLSNTFYKYIKLIAVSNRSEEAKHLIEEAISMSEETAKRRFYSREIIDKVEKINSLNNKTEIKAINKYASSNFTSNLFSRKNIIKPKIKFSNNKLNDSELIDLNINKNRNTTEKHLLQITPLNQTIKKVENYSSLINENTNDLNKDSIEHYFIIKFFESITTTVEIRTEEELNQIVIFTQPPEIAYLSNGTKSEFEREVNRDSETSKKNDLIRNVIYFQKEIKYYQSKHSKVSRFISKIDFLYVQIGSYIYALIFNLLILLTLKGDTKISFDNDETGSIRARRTDKKGIQSSIDRSIKNWAKIYDLICLLYVSINGIFIFVWIYFRMPLYYKIDSLKYMEENNIANKKQLKLYQKIYIILIMTIYKRQYITTLIYEFIFSLIGSIMKRGEIIHAFLLLPIIHLNNILKNILVSMKLQYNDICLTFFMLQ